MELLLHILANERAMPIQLSAILVYRNVLDMDDPTQIIQYLGNMMSPNFNLDVLMQSYKNNETTEMNWLFNTPFRRLIVGLIIPFEIEGYLSRLSIQSGEQLGYWKKTEYGASDPRFFSAFQGME
ncbi:hypothetical protein H1230_28520 [Paenibacillus sp. 19GGS1-52]|uniref:hypothetical protein n=1 Tax=Paenibacillus sp. 19GGS1-52 TaxID=2758563 RepID=UPI001EFC179C|nr:hypothetical protein [Paenibacillus sp. 19GGS1-52]ULO06860.1 hypothetical protein H1230_28520 [Paenibacillus sp. 19GGS1-52]